MLIQRELQINKIGPEFYFIPAFNIKYHFLFIFSFIENVSFDDLLIKSLAYKLWIIITYIAGLVDGRMYNGLSFGFLND